MGKGDPHPHPTRHEERSVCEGNHRRRQGVASLCPMGGGQTCACTKLSPLSCCASTPVKPEPELGHHVVLIQRSWS